MYWASFSDFLTMGGHGVYVWAVVLLTVLLVVIELWSIRQLKRNTIKRINRVRLLAKEKGDK